MLCKKDLSKTWDLLRISKYYSKAFMQFCDAYVSNNSSDTVTSLPNQGPYPQSSEFGGRPLGWLQLELHDVLWGLGCFLHNYHDFKTWFVPFGFALCCTSFFNEKFSISPFGVGGPLLCAPFVHETSKHSLLLGSNVEFFLFWLFILIHAYSSLDISMYWYLILWSFALSYSDKKKTWGKKKHTFWWTIVICKLIVCCL